MRKDSLAPRLSGYDFGTTKKEVVTPSSNIAIVSEAHPQQANEDASFVFIKDGKTVLAVIDGMGGHDNGEEAAKSVKKAIDAGIRNNASFTSIQHHASELIYRETRSVKAGATYIAAVIEKYFLTTCQAGDSRCLVISKDGVLIAATTDEGMLNIVSNFISGESSGSTTSGIKKLRLRSGDKVILITDGITDNSLPEEPYHDLFDNVRASNDQEGLLKERHNRENQRLVEHAKGDNPTEIANQIMEFSKDSMMANLGKRDDRTIVVYIHP